MAATPTTSDMSASDVETDAEHIDLAPADGGHERPSVGQGECKLIGYRQAVFDLQARAGVGYVPDQAIQHGMPVIADDLRANQAASALAVTLLHSKTRIPVAR